MIPPQAPPERCVECHFSAPTEWSSEDSCDSCGADFNVYPPTLVDTPNAPPPDSEAVVLPTCSKAGCNGPIVDGRCGHCLSVAPSWPSLQLPWQRDTWFAIEPDTEMVLGRTSGLFAESLSHWPNVSAQHCVLTFNDDRLIVRDTGPGKGSLNGTYVNDRRIEPNDPYELRPGDQLRLGRDCPTRGLDAVRIEVLG